MKSQKYYQLICESTAFYPFREAKYVIYSNKIWRHFLDLIKNKKKKIIDFGCGRGTVLYCLEQLRYRNIYGLDFCNSIPNDFLHHTRFFKGNLLASPFKANYFDALVSTMVIEHVDEISFVKEVYRILKKRGIVLITSILKGNLSFYFYKNAKGESVLESSHLKEYQTITEFQNLFKNNFEIIMLSKSQLVYPLIDLVFKLLLKLTGLKWFQDSFNQNKFVNWSRKIRIPILGYYAIEILVRKK